MFALSQIQIPDFLVLPPLVATVTKAVIFNSNSYIY